MDGDDPGRGSIGGIVVAAVAADSSRGGKGLDVVWIIRHASVISNFDVVEFVFQDRQR